MSEPMPEDIRPLINELDRQIDYIGTQNRLSARITELEAALEHAERALQKAENARENWKETAQEITEMNASLRTRLAEAEKSMYAYAGALGYPIPGQYDGHLSDGTTPKCGLCEAKERLRDEAEQRGRADMLKRLEDMELTTPSPIGPLWDIGWTAAIRTLKQTLTPGALSAPPPGA